MTFRNYIERAVIVTSGPELRMRPGSSAVHTLADAERAHVVVTLRETTWVVGGRSGAAARLGLPRATLIAGMQRLGLAKYPVPLRLSASLTTRTLSQTPPGSGRLDELGRLKGGRVVGLSVACRAA